MKKLNKKGFALVETLIVSAFVVSIFSIMYANFYPMMGEYEKRENYDDISLLYTSNLFKNLIEYNRKYDSMNQTITSVLNNNNYVKLEANIFNVFDKSTVSDNSSSDCFNTLVKAGDVEAIYLMPYNISTIKNLNIDSQTNEYIKSLPNYDKNNPSDSKCRIVVKYKPEGNRESSNNKNINYRFSTIGVDC